MYSIPRLALPKEFLNDDNYSRLTMLGGRLFRTLIMIVVHADLVNAVFLISLPFPPPYSHCFPLTSGIRRILDWMGEINAQYSGDLF